MAKKTKDEMFGQMQAALENLCVRFPLEFKTTLDPLHCNCLQFEDNDECRHVFALETLEEANSMVKSNVKKLTRRE